MWIINFILKRNISICNWGVDMGSKRMSHKCCYGQIIMDWKYSIIYILGNHHTTTVPVSVWMLITQILTQKHLNTRSKTNVVIVWTWIFLFLNKVICIFICCNVKVIPELQFGCVFFCCVQYVIALFKIKEKKKNGNVDEFCCFRVCKKYSWRLHFIIV